MQVTTVLYDTHLFSLWHVASSQFTIPFQWQIEKKLFILGITAAAAECIRLKCIKTQVKDHLRTIWCYKINWMVWKKKWKMPRTRRVEFFFRAMLTMYHKITGQEFIIEKIKWKYVRSCVLLFDSHLSNNDAHIEFQKTL